MRSERNAPTYHIMRLGRGQWSLTAIYHGWLKPLGDHFNSQRTAKLAARQIAGGKAKIIVASH